MTHPARLGLVFYAVTLLVAACASTASAPRPNVARPTPSSPVHLHPTVAPTACQRSCARVETCSQSADPACVNDCEENLARRGADARYEACVAALSCESIARSMSMNMGPLGGCYTHSLRGAEGR